MILSTAEVADVFDVDRTTVNRWVQLGRIEIKGRLGTGSKASNMFESVEVETFGAQLRELNSAA